MVRRSSAERGPGGAHPALERFSPATAAWFSSAFDAPTPAQEGAWRALAEDKDVLVVAPTGSGKTLAAFLAAIDRLATEPVPEAPTTRVVDVSPLRALAVLFCTHPVAIILALLRQQDQRRGVRGL